MQNGTKSNFSYLTEGNNKGPVKINDIRMHKKGLVAFQLKWRENV